MSDTPKIPLDPERIEAFAKAALEGHAEAAVLKSLLDSGAVTRALEIEDPDEAGEPGEAEMRLHLVVDPDRLDDLREINPETPESILVAAWPVSEVVVSQN